jgi:hypothetical protein
VGAREFLGTSDYKLIALAARKSCLSFFFSGSLGYHLIPLHVHL